MLLWGIFLILTTISKLKDESNNCCKFNTVFGSVEGREKGKIGRKKKKKGFSCSLEEGKKEGDAWSEFLLGPTNASYM